MKKTRVRGVSFYLDIRRLFLLGLALGLLACGKVNPSEGINSHALILVTDAQGDPVAGATVWIAEDFAAFRSEGLEVLALTDEQGNACEDPPSPALFAACTDEQGIAILPCGGSGVYLVNYFKDVAEGIINAKCGDDGVVPAPLNP